MTLRPALWRAVVLGAVPVVVLWLLELRLPEDSGADIGGPIAAVAAACLLAGVWSFHDARSGPLREHVVRWCAVAVLVFVLVGAGFTLTTDLSAADAWGEAELFAVPAIVMALTGILLRAAVRRCRAPHAR